MNQIQQIQKQESKEQRMLQKAKTIVAAKRVRRTSNRNIWTVGSGNVKTPEKWYAIQYSEELGLFCDCPAFLYCPLEDKEGLPYCCHLLAVSLFEGGLDKE